MAALLLLLLPALALASIDIEIHGDDGFMTTHHVGSQSDVITDQDRKMFNIQEAKLKDAVRVYFGKRPDDVYVRSPTPWGDLYESYGWRQIVRTLEPTSVRVVSVKTEPVIVKEEVIENKSSFSSTFKTSIYQDVANTVSSSWSKDQNFTVYAQINYDIAMSMGSVHGKNGISYTALHGQNYKKSETIRVGSKSGVEVTLGPGEKAKAYLESKKATILIEVEYEASLSGVVAVNYAKGYRGHHFWALDVEAVMSSVGLPNSIKSKETMQVNLFATTGRLLLENYTTGQRILEKFF